MNDARKQIIDAVKKLSEYDLGAWKQVGPSIQATLVDYLAGLPDSEVASIRPLAITVWREVLNGEIRGTTWHADSVILQSGAVPVSELLIDIREKAIKGLFGLFLTARDDAERREVTSALDAATRTPNQANYSDGLLGLTLKNAKQIVDFYAEHSDLLSLELAQHLEHGLLYDFRRAKSLTEEANGRYNVREEALALVTAITSLSKIINANLEFVRYKVLVGFESVYPGHWLNADYDFNDAEAHRKAEAEKYIQEVSPINQNDWLRFVERCASTKSNDLATFPVFGQFLVDFATAKPAIASEWLHKASPGLLLFLPAFLRGLSRSDRRDLYLAAVDEHLKRGSNLAGLARHLRNDESVLPSLPSRVLDAAIAQHDDGAIIEAFALILEQWGTQRIADEVLLFDKAMSYLMAHHITAWVGNTWFQPRTTAFFASLDRERTRKLLESLVDLSAIDYRSERILEQIPLENLDLIWEYFGKRLAREKPDDGTRYEAIPYELHGLAKKLSGDPDLALREVRAWYTRDRKLFRFTGGRLLSIAFPDCPEAFGEALAELVRVGDGTDADFVLDVVQNYHGEVTTHEALKRIVAQYPRDLSKMSRVRISIDSTGVVSGEFGMVEAYRAKKALIEPWLSDDRPAVRAFAEQHLKDLDLQITFEQKRAEEGAALRRLDFNDDDSEP